MDGAGHADGGRQHHHHLGLGLVGLAGQQQQQHDVGIDDEDCGGGGGGGGGGEGGLLLFGGLRPAAPAAQEEGPGLVGRRADEEEEEEVGAGAAYGAAAGVEVGAAAVGQLQQLEPFLDTTPATESLIDKLLAGEDIDDIDTQRWSAEELDKLFPDLV